MKRLTFAAAIIAGFCLHGAEPATVEELGGEIALWPDNPGKFVFVNTQKAVDAAAIKEQADRLTRDFGIMTEFIEGKAPSVTEVPSALGKLGATGALWIIADPTLPLVLAAPESGWGYLNVGTLNADKPDAAKFKNRLIKMFNRTFGYIHGCYDSTMMPQCVMRPAYGLDKIDQLVCKDHSPEAFGKIEGYLMLMGYKHQYQGTYYDACEEGWAPAPTNVVQKAIWDKVHAMPTNPIKIKPEK